ncbi:related to conserved hypothetical Ustilaginaceae-specific protein [Ustilago trichophora]|uniref:Related to conserved hypothetical Ustilaginaceae-specific protein n=1 Tax=Ustilago trichophora TaxID=86804 RepID=A0A5C3E8E8_9BASI|nr:related to conserved hypothetical Ustilaginaceae-specific protein [Ustilago trichophora]
MAPTYQLIFCSILIVTVATFVSAVRQLQGTDLEMYNRALDRYQQASLQSVGLYHRHIWEPAALERWKKGPMKNKWLIDAQYRGAIHIGESRNRLGRKVTYFSSIIVPNNDALTSEMELYRNIPVEGGDTPKEAAVFWKHVDEAFTPLKVDFLVHHRANYPLERLKDVLHKSFTRVVPYSGELP